MSLVQIHPEYSLWHSVWKLLRLQWKIFFSGIWRAKLSRKIGYLALALVIVGGAVAVFAASFFVLQILRSPQLAEFVDADLFLSSVPMLLVVIAFGAILLTSFGVLLQSLYLAADMDFLLSAPVPVRAVFVAKLLQAILPGFGLVCLFGLPVLYGLGAAGRYHVLYYPLVVVVLAVEVLAAAGLASVLVMAVVRVFPARRVAEMLGLIGGISGLLCSQSNLLFRSTRVSEGQVGQALVALTRLNTPWSPLAWAGRALVDIGEGRWLSGIGFLLLTLGIAGAIFAVTLTTAERLYHTGWARVQIGTRRKQSARSARPGNGKAAPLAALVGRHVPTVVRGLIVKDALVIRRDLRNMSQLLTPLILGAIYAVALIQGGGQAPAGRGEAPTWFMEGFRTVLMYGNVGISLFVGWSLLSRLAMMGFSQEGKHYWLLKAAPISAGQLLAAKFMVAYLPTLILGWLFLSVISLMQHVSLAAFLFSLPVVALSIAGGAGISLALGVVGVNLEWEDPRRMMRGTTGCIGALINVTYLIVVLILFFAPAIGFMLLGLPEAAGQITGLALGGIASLACAVIPLRLVRDRVPRIGEA